jgi:hypothetical protein
LTARRASNSTAVLCDGDGPIMKLREWYAGFYDDNHPAE